MRRHQGDDLTAMFDLNNESQSTVVIELNIDLYISDLLINTAPVVRVAL